MAEDVAAELDETLNLDAADRTRTIRATADTPAEINQMFDGITYEKGGAVIGMVERYLGEDDFRRGVHDYLSAHKFANATAEDFWNAQTRDSGKPVDQIMSSFIAQPGVPLLRFAAPVQRAAGVSQSRFFLTPSASSKTDESWTVPVCVKTAALPDCTVVTPSATSIAAPSAPVFFGNANAHGYYRSEYEPTTYQALFPQVESVLTAEERMLLLGDEWALMRAGRGSLADVLNLVHALRNDPSAGVLASIGGPASSSRGGKLGYLQERIATDPERRQLASLTRQQFGPVYAQLPPALSGDSYELSQRRAILFQLLGLVGEDPQIIAEAMRIADRWVGDPASVDPNLAQPALILAARHGRSTLFDQLQHLAETSADPAVQNRSLYMLALFTDPALELRMLEYAVSGKVRNQDVVSLLSIPFSSYLTRDLAWQFVQSHWTQVRAQLTPLSGGYLVSSAGGFCSADKKKEVDRFYATHTFSESPRPLQIADDQISSCMALRAAQEPRLADWLRITGDGKSTASEINRP